MNKSKTYQSFYLFWFIHNLAKVIIIRWATVGDKSCMSPMTRIRGALNNDIEFIHASSYLLWIFCIHCVCPYQSLIDSVNFATRDDQNPSLVVSTLRSLSQSWLQIRNCKLISCVATFIFFIYIFFTIYHHTNKPFVVYVNFFASFLALLLLLNTYKWMRMTKNLSFHFTRLNFIICL